MIEEMYKEEFADSSDSDALGGNGNNGGGRTLHFDDWKTLKQILKFSSVLWQEVILEFC